MKILQLLTKNANFTAAGYGVCSYVEHMKKAIMIAGYTLAEFTIKTESDIAKLAKMEQDIVFFHSMPFVDNPLRAKIYAAINDMKGKKILFLNDHVINHIETVYGDVFSNSKIINIFDNIVTFSYESPAYKQVRQCIGEAEANKKFIPMRHPYMFDDKARKQWVDAKDKVKMITYMGRFAPFKDPARLIRGRYPFMENGFDIEFRGIEDNKQINGIENFKYEFNWKGLPIGPSNIVNHVDNCFINRYELDVYSDLLNVPRNGKIWWFETYKKDVMRKTMSKVAFGADFFNLDNMGILTGNNLEYAQMEIIDYGTIGIFDFVTAKLNKMYVNNKPFASLIDQDACIGLSKILDNMQNCADKCLHIFNNPKLYDTMRNRAYDIVKAHANPKDIIIELVSKINRQ